MLDSPEIGKRVGSKYHISRVENEIDWNVVEFVMDRGLEDAKSEVKIMVKPGTSG